MIITDELKSKIADLAKKRGLSLVVLFGSQATGYTHKMSDIDIGYISEKDIDYGESYDITIELSKIFKNRNVEFVNMQSLYPAFMKQIADKGMLLYEDNFGRFIAF